MGSRLNKKKYKNALQSKKVPILTLDEKWHELFPTRLKTHTIKALEAKVNQELKKHGKLRSDLVDYTELKKKLLDGIMGNMEGTLEAAGEKEQSKLEQSKKMVEELNERLDKTQEELLTIPQKLDQVNKELLVVGLEYCYNKMHKNAKSINSLDQYITETRELLKQKIIEKQELEEENTRIYTYLHNVIGYDILELMDIKREEIIQKEENN